MGETSIPAPIQPEPVALADLFDLFVRPAQFFSGRIALGRTPALVAVAWIVGVARQRAAAVWFLVLPCIVFVVVLAGRVLAMLMTMRG